MQIQTDKKFFVSEIIASELAVLNCLLLSREYLSSAVNMLANIPKT